MKRVLIVNKSFALGGIQSSMINMANELSKYYKVDLYVYNPVGIMKDRLENSVTILTPSYRFRALGMSFSDAVKTRNLKIILFRVFATVWTKLFGNKYPIECAIRRQPKLIGYDIAIAYHHEQKKRTVTSGFVRFVDSCVEAKKKLAWIHYDVNFYNRDNDYNNQFYQKMDKIICVSQSLGKSFAEKNKTLSDKTDYCYNFMFYDLIRNKGNLQQEIAYPKDKFICFSACRLEPVKAIVRAVEALADTFKSNEDLMWYIAGDGSEREKIEKKIRAYGLHKNIILIGNQPNPYPYMKNAHLIMNLSYHEAAPVVFFESKALEVPVFATRTLSADELLCDKKNAFLCENSSEGIKNTFEWLIKNRNLVQQAKNNLNGFDLNNNESILKIKCLFGDI